MKKIYTILATVILTVIVLLPQQVKAQSPDKMSYQAVIRTSSQNLVKNQAVGIQMSILQGSAMGVIVYVEKQTPTTNANGLISIEIGNGTVVSGSFSAIDWANGPYFIKTETDPSGGSNYTISGTSELLSVPYALFAKTADSVTTPESDPIFGASIAAAINATDTNYWNSKLDNFTEIDPIFTNSLANMITAIDTTHWGTVYGWGNHNAAGYFGDGGEATGANRSLGNLDSKSLAFLTDSLERIFITSDGKVGIGTSTPTTDFEVDGNTKLNGTIIAEGSNANGTFQLKETTLAHTAVHNSILQISNTSNITNSQANIKFDAGSGGHGRAIISSQADGYGGATYGGLLNFKVRYGATSYHTAIMIRGNGRVGIGTSNPQAPLHVVGRIYQSGTGNSTFIGEFAGENDNLTNNNNVFVGNRSGYTNTNGYYNVAVGYRSLYSNTTGSYNTANGYNSLNNNISGHHNSASGSYALLSNTTGNYNTALGCSALNYTSTGSYNTAVGYYTNVSSTYSNSTAIGFNAHSGTSNRIYLGNSSITWIGGHSAWYNTSDARAKRNIKEDVAGLDFIMNLRPVTYFFDKDKMDELMEVKDSSDYPEKYEINKIKQSGFLAQEVETAANKAGYDFIGLSKPKDDVKNYSLSYAMFVVPLVKATQEQQKIIEKQQQTIDEMKKELAEIKAMLLEKK